MTDSKLAPLTGHHHIAGTRRREASVSFSGRDPRTGEALDPGYAEATPREVDDALRGSLEAASVLKHADAKRALLLARTADNIEALGDLLLTRAEQETALPRARLEGERARTLHQLRLFAKLVENGSFRETLREAAEPERKPQPKPELLRKMLPIGPVVVFGASNFPFAYSVAGGDTASAFAAGCPVVVKAHPNHPGTSELVANAVDRAVEQVGLPGGTFSLLQSALPETALGLVRHPAARAVGFTGSERAGRALFDATSSRPDPIPVFAEMGSVNPVFLLPQALEERAETIAAGLHASFTLGVGQFCTSPGLVFLVKGASAERFLKALRQKVEATPAGTLLHAGIHTGYAGGLDALGKLEGVDLLAKGARPSGACDAAAHAWLTSYANYERHARLHEELFGPSTLVVVCESRAELVHAAAPLRGQLTATLHAATGELTRFADLFSILEDRAGRLVFNGFPTGVEVTRAMQHGGPYPASTDVRFSAVGDAAILRFLRPVCYQGFSEGLPI